MGVGFAVDGNSVAAVAFLGFGDDIAVEVSAHWTGAHKILRLRAARSLVEHATGTCTGVGMAESANDASIHCGDDLGLSRTLHGTRQ